MKRRGTLMGALRRAAVLSGLEACWEADSPSGATPCLEVVVVGAETMAALNETHLGHAGPTDVLAFDLSEGEPMPGEDAWIRGEVYLCLDVAVAQAPHFGNTVGEELMLYAVHGMLHLAGHDDHEAEPRCVMRREERRILTALGDKFPLSSML